MQERRLVSSVEPEVQKSSLVNLISRLYDVTTGSIKVGGMDVRSYDMETLRNQVAVVLQKMCCFPERFWTISLTVWNV